MTTPPMMLAAAEDATVGVWTIAVQVVSLAVLFGGAAALLWWLLKPRFEGWAYRMLVKPVQQINNEVNNKQPESETLRAKVERIDQANDDQDRKLDETQAKLDRHLGWSRSHGLDDPEA